MSDNNAKPRWGLVDEWHWVLSHSWSLRFVFIAFVLSGLEVFLPLFTDTTTIPRVAYAALIALVTGAAFVARLTAQHHEAPHGE
jgi:hypothetical protein